MCLKSGDPGFDGKQLHFEVDKERQTGTYQEASGGKSWQCTAIGIHGTAA